MRKSQELCFENRFQKGIFYQKRYKLEIIERQQMFGSNGSREAERERGRERERIGKLKRADGNKCRFSSP
jgi:hypothetical protein